MAGAIFVVAGGNHGQQGPIASLVSTAGWASAAARVVGDAWIATAEGIVETDEARRQGSNPTLRSDVSPGLRRRVPTPVKTAAKDLRNYRHARHFRIDPAGPWSGTRVTFVWQRHELFQRAGLHLAADLDVPSVLFVPATLVWEAEQWGTRRPGWGRWLEQIGEGPALRSADLVACGTTDVAEQVERLGVPTAKILETPTGVDLDVFRPGVDADRTRRDLGIDNDFVVGWVGSFRRFHAIEQAVEAVAGMERTTLLLVGDGPERPRIEALSRDLGVRAVFTGTVGHHDLPSHLAAMDAALVMASPGAPFHYSPLKLAEYLAAGLPVVAPDVDHLRRRLVDGVDAVLATPHDATSIGEALRRLRDDPAERARLGAAARGAAEDSWSWDHQVRRVVEALDRRAGHTG